MTDYSYKVEESKAIINEKLTKLQVRHEKVNEGIRGIKSYSERLISAGTTKVSQASKSKLIALYNTTLKLCEHEADVVRSVLREIQELRNIEFEAILGGKMSRGQMISLLNEQAKTLPLHVGAVDGHPPEGVGAIPLKEKDEIPVDSIVAAFVDDVWILAKVVGITGRKYDIRDIDDENCRRISIKRRLLVPLPNYKADPQRDRHALFPVNAIVLALYPQTTCFYKGVVERQPQSAHDDYLVAFEDTSFDTGYSPPFIVPQRYVIMYKNIQSKSKDE